MDKKSRNILILFGAALLTIIIIEVTRPKPVNWKPSYTSVDKIPFGSYILYKELTKISKDKNVNLVSKNPYEFLSDSTYNANSAYLFINTNLDFDKRSYEKLIAFVRQGNSVFMAARYFGKTLKDSLHIETDMDYQITEEEITPTFFSSSLQQDSLPKFKKGVYKSVFKSFDTTKTKVLGYLKNEEEKLSQINFIKITEGKGEIYVNTIPEAFSNYYMLKDNGKYAAGTLSFLQNTPTLYWDDYLKSGRKIIDSPMRFVLNQIPLRWAYYLLITGLLLFILFKGKREQRIIPVVKPLQNTSVEFTKTIGDLYFQHKDYSDIIFKKITYFLEKLRSQYYLNTNELDAKFIDKLAVKSGHPVTQTKELVDHINTLKGKIAHTEADLIALNKKIEKFTL